MAAHSPPSFADMSHELLCYILQYLPLKEVLSISMLCKKLSTAVDMHLRLRKYIDFCEGKLYGYMSPTLTDEHMHFLFRKCPHLETVYGLHPLKVERRRLRKRSALTVPGIIEALSLCCSLKSVETSDLRLFEAIMQNLPKIEIIGHFQNRDGVFPPHASQRLKLQPYPRISSLHLIGVEVPELTAMPRLEHLHLQCVRFTKLQPFRAFLAQNLKTFVMKHCMGPQLALRYLSLIIALSSSPSLSRLELVRVPLPGGLFQRAVEDSYRHNGFVNLKTLIISGCKGVMEADVGHLMIVASKKLETIFIQPSLTRDSLFVSLSFAQCEFPKLKSIHLGYMDKLNAPEEWSNDVLLSLGLAEIPDTPSSLTDSGMKVISQLFPNIKSLSVSNCPHLMAMDQWSRPIDGEQAWRELTDLTLQRCHCLQLPSFALFLAFLPKIEVVILNDMFREPPKGCSHVGLSAGTGLGMSSAVVSNQDEHIAVQGHQQDFELQADEHAENDEMDRDFMEIENDENPDQHIMVLQQEFFDDERRIVPPPVRHREDIDPGNMPQNDPENRIRRELNDDYNVALNIEIMQVSDMENSDRSLDGDVGKKASSLSSDEEENSKVDASLPETDVKKSPEKDVKKSPEKDVKKSPEKDVKKSPEKDVKKSPETDVKKSPETDVKKFPEKDVEKSPEKDVKKSPEKHVKKSSYKGECKEEGTVEKLPHHSRKSYSQLSSDEEEGLVVDKETDKNLKREEGRKKKVVTFEKICYHSGECRNKCSNGFDPNQPSTSRDGNCVDFTCSGGNDSIPKEESSTNNTKENKADVPVNEIMHSKKRKSSKNDKDSVNKHFKYVNYNHDLVKENNSTDKETVKDEDDNLDDEVFKGPLTRNRKRVLDADTKRESSSSSKEARKSRRDHQKKSPPSTASVNNKKLKSSKPVKQNAVPNKTKATSASKQSELDKTANHPESQSKIKTVDKAPKVEEPEKTEKLEEDNDNPKCKKHRKHRHRKCKRKRCDKLCHKHYPFTRSRRNRCLRDRHNVVSQGTQATSADIRRSLRKQRTCSSRCRRRTCSSSHRRSHNHISARQQFKRPAQRKTTAEFHNKSTSTSDPLMEDDAVQTLRLVSETLITLTIISCGISDVVIDHCQSLTHVEVQACRILKMFQLHYSPSLKRLNISQCPKLALDAIIPEVILLVATRKILVSFEPCMQVYNPAESEKAVFSKTPLEQSVILFHDFTDNANESLQAAAKENLFRWMEVVQKLYYTPSFWLSKQRRKKIKSREARSRYPYGHNLRRIHGVFTLPADVDPDATQWRYEILTNDHVFASALETVPWDNGFPAPETYNSYTEDDALISMIETEFTEKKLKMRKKIMSFYIPVCESNLLTE